MSDFVWILYAEATVDGRKYGAQLPIVGSRLQQTTSGVKIVPSEERPFYADAALRAMGLPAGVDVEFTKLIETERLESKDGPVDVFKHNHEVAFA